MPVIYLTYAYLVSGLIFSIPFLCSWIKAVDEGAHDTSWAFKLIILPGCIIFWPVLLYKYIIAKRNN